MMQLDDRCRKLRSVESLNTAGRSLRAVEVGRVIECSWMIIAGSWGRSSRWMQLDDRCGKLRSVESSNAAGRSLREAEVGQVVFGKSMFRFWQYVVLTGGVSIWLLARQRVVRELVVAMLGQSVTVNRYVDCMLHCGSVDVGRSIYRFLTVHWVNWGVSFWLLASTASRTWARYCNARAVCNSESLRGLDAALLERRGW